MNMMLELNLTKLNYPSQPNTKYKSLIHFIDLKVNFDCGWVESEYNDFPKPSLAHLSYELISANVFKKISTPCCCQKRKEKISIPCYY